MDHTDTTALVTGASSGIGREFARALAARGADLVLVARRADVLEDLAQSLRAAHGRVVTVVPLDLTQPASGTRLLTELDRLGVRVDTVVNCAGIGLTRDFVDSTPSELEDQLAVNIDAVVDVCHAFLPRLVSSGRGVLLNVASLTAYMPTPGMAVYAASKAFVLRFTEALAYELRDAGVTVMAFSPGPTKTEFYRNSGTDEGRVRFETPEQVVAAAFRALDKPTPPVSAVSGSANTRTSRIAPLLPRRTVLRLADSSPRTTA
ncbi:SDR family oxidoreductase [Curtobacterium sp. MCPF17_050]|uniref:SDR family NAD(P)-dependent oxidoreductase n=1 Tax=Curtobacterium sp. MCPF17_050 TaxID=2175664 RepID=UPI000D9E7D3F|nr:SDR family oxidoreductase [Curtobacterium sp. MCPF17_050]WIB16079.1 SDR family oxidoreductase [Curtobacterium sp. MCPF17_050]